jgi:hypothetical protein
LRDAGGEITECARCGRIRHTRTFVADLHESTLRGRAAGGLGADQGGTPGEMTIDWRRGHYRAARQQADLSRERFIAWRREEPGSEEWVSDCEQVEVEEGFSASEPVRLTSANRS